jgi:hypothetical protein
MRAYLAGVPTWVSSVISGVLFGAAMTVYSVVRDGSLPWAYLTVMGALVGAAFGITLHLLVGRELGASRAELAALPLDQRREALRAMGRHPVPTDPTVRRVALNQALATRDLYRRRTRFTLATFGVFLLLEAFLAITSSPWYWAAVALFAVMAAAQVVLPRRLDRRIALLSDSRV